MPVGEASSCNVCAPASDLGTVKLTVAAPSVTGNGPKSNPDTDAVNEVLAGLPVLVRSRFDTPNVTVLPPPTAVGWSDTTTPRFANDGVRCWWLRR